MHKNIDNNCTINFKGSHFPSAIIMQAIRWYTAYSLSYRDVEVAYSFFLKAIGTNGIPDKVNIDKSGANLSVLKAINKTLAKDSKIVLRQIKYLNNIIEQDHRPIKLITRPMLGFKCFAGAAATLVGIELQRMLKKG
ncbi:MAG: DDE-type integrase/transposase/recombinase [Rickettsiaceae bacterium]